MVHSSRILRLGPGQELAIGYTMCLTDPMCQIVRLRESAPPSSGRFVEPMLDLTPQQLDTLISALVEMREAMPRPPGLHASVRQLLNRIRSTRPRDEDSSHQAQMRPLGEEWAKHTAALGFECPPSLRQLADGMADVYVEAASWVLLDPDDSRHYLAVIRRTKPEADFGAPFMWSEEDLLLVTPAGGVLAWDARGERTVPVASSVEALFDRLSDWIGEGRGDCTLDVLAST